MMVLSWERNEEEKNALGINDISRIYAKICEKLCCTQFELQDRLLIDVVMK
jgi:hypothetical protein